VLSLPFPVILAVQKQYVMKLDIANWYLQSFYW